MQDVRVRNVIAAIAIAIALVSGGVIYGGRHTSPPITITGSEPASPNPSTGDPGIGNLPDAASAAPVPLPPLTPYPVTPLPSNKIYVHVAGAVKHPDLYTLPLGTRVAGALKAAGGATADANIDAINLAEKVVDGEKIYVPRKGEAVTTSTDAGNSVGMTSSMPHTDFATSGPQSTNSGNSHHRGMGVGHGETSNKLTDPKQGKVNINTASATELERLPGVGPATAARIIDYRKQNGGFKKPEDLMDIGGIGDKKMAKLAPFVTVR